MRGMKFNGEPRYQVIDARVRWVELFDQFARDDVQFVIMIDPKVLDTHGEFLKVKLEIGKYGDFRYA